MEAIMLQLEEELLLYRFIYTWNYNYLLGVFAFIRFVGCLMCTRTNRNSHKIVYKQN